MKQVAIVLGGGITSKGKLPYDPHTRIRKAFSLYKKGKVDTFILSGGFVHLKNKKISEAKLYEEYLFRHGVPKFRIIREEESHDTIGNAVYVKKIFLKKKLPKKATIITSQFHLKRSLEIFEYVFGSKYSFSGIGSHPSIPHRIWLALKEWRNYDFDLFVLAQAKEGDHRKIERYMRKMVPRYHKK